MHQELLHHRKSKRENLLIQLFFADCLHLLSSWVLLQQYLQKLRYRPRGIAIEVITLLILSVAVWTSCVPIPPSAKHTLLFIAINVSVVLIVDNFVIIFFFLFVKFIVYQLLYDFLGHIVKKNSINYIIFLKYTKI